MAKLLKPLVVLVLLVAIAALVMQLFVLYPQREVVKNRTLKLEDGIERVVKTLKASLPEDLQSAIKFDKKKLAVQKAEDLGQMDAPIKIANTAAETVIQQWEDTKAELETAYRDLEQTRAELDQTKAELEAARATVQRLQGEIAEKNTQIAQLNESIAGLEEEKATLESTVQSKDDEIAQLEADKANLEEEKTMLEGQLEKCSQAQDTTRSLPPGTVGKVVMVNPAWQYLIVDLGANQGAALGAELMVHRGDQYLGKIRLSAIRDDVSIADFLPGAKINEIKENDDVLF